jgi:iron complex transport system substrate-binding protein
MRRFFVVLWQFTLLWPIGQFARAETIDYTDKLGRHVRIQAPAHRAVVLSQWEIIPALHCWDKVVGFSSGVSSWDFMLQSVPNLLQKVTVGTAYDPNTETLLKLRPDLVVTSDYRPEHVRFLEQKGLTVIALNPDTIADMIALVELEGRLFGHRSEAQRTIREMRSVLDLVESRNSRIPPSQRKKVLWLSLSTNMVGGGPSMTSDMIGLIGARNVAGALAGKSQVVPIESIIGWNPDVILIVGNARYGKREILDNPQWRFIKAVRDKQVYKSPRWSTWSPRAALIVLWMAAKTYPAYYNDVDLRAVADHFHREVFREPLMDRDLNDF